MIDEHEVIEQIEEEPLGRTLPWVCELLRSFGRRNPLEVLDGMHRAGYVAFLHSTGEPLLDWEWKDVVRSGVAPTDIFVVATESGSRWVH